MTGANAAAPIPLRIFLSSPGDVSDERGLALMVLDRLQYDPFLRGRVAFEVVAWDKPGAGAPLLATVTPQASIDAGLPRPSECDIVVVVLWSRMGTPLPHPEYAKPDGSPYASGTEWEFEDALRGAHERGVPDVLLYRRTTKVLLDPDDPSFDAQLTQKRLVDVLFDRLRDPETGTIRAGYKHYASPEEFRSELEFDLKELIRRRLGSARSAEESPAASADAVAPLWEGSPFPGLRAFTTADARIFFGRGRETDELVARIAATRFVAVVGASGSGKSSLVAAGLLPRLAVGAVPAIAGWLLPSFDPRANQWKGLRFTPGELGDDPFVALALRLAPLVGADVREVALRLAQAPSAVVDFVSRALEDEKPGTEALVVVDQFEELFTSVSAARVEPFVALLEVIDRSPNAHAVVTMRSDFYDRCLELPALARLLESGQFPLAAPRDTLYEMITRPAERAGLRFEEGLVGRILNDTGRDASALPLLAYALHELYHRRGDERALTFAAYDVVGGVRGAIGTRAEAVFRQLLDEATQATFSHVFRELAEIDEHGQVARRRIRLGEVAVDDYTRRFIEVFTKARLLVQSGERGREPIVFVAHEALFRSWPRLQAWIQLAQDDLQVLRKVRAAAQEWASHGHDDSYLWPHERLEAVEAAIQRLEPSVDDVTEAFIRPEYERLLTLFMWPGTEPHRREVIVDRLIAIGAPSVPALLEAMQADNTRARAAARRGLVRIGGPSVTGLMEMWQHSRADVRLDAILALGEIGDFRAVSALVAALRDKDQRVRSLAAGILERMKSSHVAAELAKVLSDPDVDVRWRAVGTLGAFGEAAVTPLLRSLHDVDLRVRTEAREALRAIGERGIDRLLETLHDEQAQLRASAAETLAALGAPAVPGLLVELGDEDPDVRWRAAQALHVCGDSSAAPALVTALGDPNVRIRHAAATALGACADAAGIAALVDALDDADSELADLAASALAARGPRAAEPLLNALRRGRGGPTRGRAARALSNLDAVDCLITALQDDDPSMRPFVVAALGHCGAAAVGPLLETLRDERPSVRDGAAAALRDVGDAAVPQLLERARDPDARVRRAALALLKGSGDHRAEAVLADALADEDEATRTVAADGLAALGKSSLPRLFDALEGDPTERSAAARGLVALGGWAIPGLLRFAMASDEDVARTAIAALAGIATPAALFGLAELGLEPRSVH